MKIAITTVSDAGYLPAACCQLRSVHENLDGKTVDLFLVCCDTSDAQVDSARRYFDSRSVPVTIVVAQAIAERIVPITRKWPRAAYLRLYFDEIFEPAYDRLVYFDADTRVRSTLSEFLGSDLRGQPVGAVHDFIYYLTGNIRRRRRDLDLADDAPYLQSGVMIFDWPHTLNDGGLGRARQALVDNPSGCHEAPDQDALNMAFEGRWTPLDPRWNLHETYLNFGGTLQPFLEHYTSTKPWTRLRPPRWADAAEWYRRELAGTMWDDFIPSQSALDRLQSRAGFLKFRYAPRLRDALAKRAPAVLDFVKVPRTRDDSEELPWAPRCRKDVEDMASALIDEALGRRPAIRPPESVLDAYKRGELIGLQ